MKYGLFDAGGLALYKNIKLAIKFWKFSKNLRKKRNLGQNLEEIVAENKIFKIWW